MNALQATERMEKLAKRMDALSRVICYIDDDRDLDEEISELKQLHRYAESEYQQLEEKLRAVQI